jgi:hypothetical protein
MATHTLVNPVYWKGRSNSGPLFRGTALALGTGGGENPTLREADTQTYRIGDLVYLDASGNVALVTLATATVDSAILGFAARAAQGGTDKKPAYVQIIRPDDYYLMQVFHATPSLSVTAQTHLGEVFPIIKDATNNTYHIDLATTAEGSSTTLARVMVVGFPEGDIRNGVVSTITDTNGWAVVKFLEFSLETTADQALQRLLQG